MFAKQPERLYYDGLQAYVRDDFTRAQVAFEACAEAAPSATSARLFAAVCANQLGHEAAELRHLEAVVQSVDPLPDPLQTKYLPPWVGLTLQIKITDIIRAEAPFDSIGACLALAERYQEAGRLDEAIGLVQQLNEANPSDQAIALSLTDLLMADKDYQGVVQVAANASNDNDLGAAMLHMRGMALLALGHQSAAIDAFRDALAKPSRDKELLKAIRYDRAAAYEAIGQTGRARQDYERVYATDPAYADVAARLKGDPVRGDKDGGGAQPADGPMSSVEHALERMERLRARGLITDEEYAAKRKEILDRL